MPTIQENLDRIKNAKSAIKAAIRQKGIEVSDLEKIETYADKILQIKKGVVQRKYLNSTLKDHLQYIVLMIGVVHMLNLIIIIRNQQYSIQLMVLHGKHIQMRRLN